jgi:tetrahydromethanopterin S-methyltransferase subunit A
VTEKIRFRFGEATLKKGIWTVRVRHEGAEASESLTPEMSGFITWLIASDHRRRLIACGMLSMIAENLRMMICMQESTLWHLANGDGQTAISQQEVLNESISGAFDWMRRLEDNEDDGIELFNSLVESLDLGDLGDEDPAN